MQEQSEADSIRRQMEYLRGELNEQYGAIVDRARVLTDWHHYVRSYPWACVGAAAALGFLAVPKRMEVISPDADTLAELARRNQLVVQQKPEPRTRGGIVAPLVTLVANAALRAAIAYAGQRTGKLFSSDAADQPAQEVRR